MKSMKKMQINICISKSRIYLRDVDVKNKTADN